MIWYAVATRSGSETKVAKSVTRALAKAGVRPVQAHRVACRLVLLQVPDLEPAMLSALSGLKDFEGFWGGSNPIAVPEDDVAAFDKRRRRLWSRINIRIGRGTVPPGSQVTVFSARSLLLPAAGLVLAVLGLWRLGWLPIAALVLVGLLLVNKVQAAVRRHKHAQHFQSRELLTPEQVFQRYYQSRGYAEPEVLRAWGDALSIVPLDGARLRPSDTIREVGLALSTKQHVQYFEAFERLVREHARSWRSVSFGSLDDIVTWLLKQDSEELRGSEGDRPPQ